MLPLLQKRMVFATALYSSTQARVSGVPLFTKKDDDVLRGDMAEIAQVNGLLASDHYLANDETMSVIKTNKYFARIYVEQFKNEKLKRSHLEILKYAHTVVPLYNSMDEETKNEFIDTIIKISQWPDYDSIIVKSVTSLCLYNEQAFIEKIIEKIIETKNYGCLFIFQYTDVFEQINEELCEKLRNFLLSNINKVHHGIIIDGVKNDELFNVQLKEYLLSLLTDNKLRPWFYYKILQLIIQKNKDFAETFVNYAVDNKTIQNYHFDHDRIQKILYENLSHDTKNKLYDYIVQNYKEFDKLFIINSMQYSKKCLLRNKFLRCIIDNSDYNMLQKLTYAPQPTLFYVERGDDDSLCKEFVDFLFKNVYNAKGDQHFTYDGKVYTLSIFSLCSISSNIRDKGLEQCTYFTEIYIDYIIETKNNTEFETLSPYDVTGLFNNTGKNKTKLIEYIITNIDNINKKFISDSIYCYQFRGKLIEWMIRENKFMLEIEACEISSLWYYVSHDSCVFFHKPCELQLRFEQLIYKDIELFNDEQLKMLCYYWDQHFVKKCIEKLEQNDKNKVELCRKWMR
jgi:hypothetical protein